MAHPQHSHYSSSEQNPKDLQSEPKDSSAVQSGGESQSLLPKRPKQQQQQGFPWKIWISRVVVVGLFLLATVATVSYCLSKKAPVQPNINNDNKGFDYSNYSIVISTDSTLNDTITLVDSHQQDVVEVSGVSIPLPLGVNFGSWLSLEDYFYVGDTGAVEVATPDDQKAAVCLPPLYTGGAAWQSETDLLSSLIQSIGLIEALRVFQAHRKSFIEEADLQRLQSWGIRHVRVPVSWCFTNADDPDLYIKNLPNKNMSGEKSELDDELERKLLLEQFTCADPFYPNSPDKDDGVLWPAIPRSLLLEFLRNCAKYNITASLDLHTYPGGTSPGTFSGVWPRPPRFWQHDDPENENDFGRGLYRNFVRWVESLATEDPLAFQGIQGIGPMNEPAHLAGIFATLPNRDYLPPLPTHLAESYWDELNHPLQGTTNITIPKGPHLRVMKWLDDSIQFFRNSSLPQLGKQLHVNVHESFLSASAILSSSSLPLNDDSLDWGGRHPAATNVIAAWWSRVTTRSERRRWAVLDMHHYHAWEPFCQGAIKGGPHPVTSNYTCDNTSARNEALARCTSWATDVFRAAVDVYCGPNAKLMSGEFSTSTHHRVHYACNDVDTIRASYLAQMRAARKAKVAMYYWSYKMPYGGDFRKAWSFSQLLFQLKISNAPRDESKYSCGGGGVPQMTDDSFA